MNQFYEKIKRGKSRTFFSNNRMQLLHNADTFEFPVPFHIYFQDEIGQFNYRFAIPNTENDEPMSTWTETEERGRNSPAAKALNYKYNPNCLLVPDLDKKIFDTDNLSELEVYCRQYGVALNSQVMGPPANVKRTPLVYANTYYNDNITMSLDELSLKDRQMEWGDAEVVWSYVYSVLNLVTNGRRIAVPVDVVTLSRLPIEYVRRIYMANERPFTKEQGKRLANALMMAYDRDVKLFGIKLLGDLAKDEAIHNELNFF